MIKEKEWNEINELPIEYYIKLSEESSKNSTSDIVGSGYMYHKFQEIKDVYINKFNGYIDDNNFNDFYMEIERSLNGINNKIESNMFYTNKSKWDRSILDDWIMELFWNRDSKSCKLLKLQQNGSFNTGANAFMAKILKDKINSLFKTKLDVVYMEGYEMINNTDKFAEIFNDFSLLETLDEFDKFMNTLTGDEYKVLHYLMFLSFKFRSNKEIKITQKNIYEHLNISKQTFLRIITKLTNKYENFKEIN